MSEHVDIADESIGEYASLILKHIELVLHDGVQLYLDEVPLNYSIAEMLTQNGWASTDVKTRYPNSDRRADIVTHHPEHQLKIINETKYLICDFPGAKRGNKKWTVVGGVVAQHLGIKSGKDINAVDDVQKLNMAVGTHVSFLLICFESVARCGDESIRQFVNLTGLNNKPWNRFDAQWPWIHSLSIDHLVKCHLWCRPISQDDNQESRSEN